MEEDVRATICAYTDAAVNPTLFFFLSTVTIMSTNFIQITYNTYQLHYPTHL
jgi:hypothetical protein